MAIQRVAMLAAVLTIGAAAIGCETKAQNGALIGALGGAAIGGAIGNNNGGHGLGGAAIGAAAGGIGGALVGHGMDKHDEKKEREREARRYEEQHDRRDNYGYSRGGGDNAPANGKISKRDVIEWNSRGVKDEIIIDRIERSGQVFRLTAADENELRDEGVSESVIRAMKDTARR
jgi:hypothetical protein